MERCCTGRHPSDPSPRTSTGGCDRLCQPPIRVDRDGTAVAGSRVNTGHPATLGADGAVAERATAVDRRRGRAVDLRRRARGRRRRRAGVAPATSGQAGRAAAPETTGRTSARERRRQRRRRRERPAGHGEPTVTARPRRSAGADATDAGDAPAEQRRGAGRDRGRDRAVDEHAADRAATGTALGRRRRSTVSGQCGAPRPVCDPGQAAATVGRGVRGRGRSSAGGWSRPAPRRGSPTPMCCARRDRGSRTTSSGDAHDGDAARRGTRTTTGARPRATHADAPPIAERPDDEPPRRTAIDPRAAPARVAHGPITTSSRGRGRESGRSQPAERGRRQRARAPRASAWRGPRRRSPGTLAASDPAREGSVPGKPTMRISGCSSTPVRAPHRARTCAMRRPRRRPSRPRRPG